MQVPAVPQNLNRPNPYQSFNNNDVKSLKKPHGVVGSGQKGKANGGD